MFNLFRFCRKDEISFDIVAQNGNIVAETGNIVAKNGNNVEATLDTVERTKFYNRIVRHCCRLWQQSRTLLRQCCMLLRHCCWCGRGLTDDADRRRQTTDDSEQDNTGPLGGPVINFGRHVNKRH